MKILFYMLGMMAVCAACGFAQEAQPVEKTVTKDEVLKAIALFRQDPLRAKEKGAGPVIMSFAEQSKDVEVAMGPKVVPWMDDKANEKYADVLLMAFVAGDMRSQLEGHTAKDDPMAGALQVIDTYQFLKKSDPKLRVESVEQWIVLQAQGKLRSEVEVK